MVVEGLYASDVEEAFIGRDDDFKCLDEEWVSRRLFGIYGIRAVGKSRFVTEFIQRKAEQLDSRKRLNIPVDNNLDDTLNCEDRGTVVQGIKVVYQDLRVLVSQSDDISSLYSGICVSLGVVTRPQAADTTEWISHIIEELGQLKNSYDCIVIFLDNVEDVTEGRLHDDFMKFCTWIIRSCSFVKTIITSSTKIMLAQLRRVYHTQELKPLNFVDSKALLRSVTRTTDLGEYEDEIVKRSEGLPLLILMVGSELDEDGGMLSPADMVYLLNEHRMQTLTKEFYPEEDRVADVYRKFINRLKPVLRDHLKSLEYIPGSFSADHAMNILDFETTAVVKDQVLIPIRRRYILRYDPINRRFDIQGVLREVLQIYHELPNLPEVRRRYCETFTAVMIRLSQLIGKENYTEALAELVHEQPNLRKLMIDVEFTREDTYPFFIHIAEKCTSLIEQFLSTDCDKFYNGCIKFAHIYGREKDKAVVYLAVGSMCTNVKNELTKGAENYEKALAILQSGDRTLSLATVYQRMGWNLHCQGRNSEAIGYFQKSLDISLTSGPEFQLLSLQSMNSLGVTNTVLGRFDEAEKYHFRSLERRKSINGEKSPLVGATLNNIGVFYDQKEEYDKALEYYLAGYELKKGPRMPIPTQVFSLSNIASAYARNKQFEKAHELLDEALNMLKQLENESLSAVALIYDTIGKVLRAEKRLEEADNMFKQAVEIRENITPEGINYFESLVHLAQTRLRRDLLPSAIKVAKKALILRDKSIECMPQNSYISECLRCMATVYKLMHDDVKYRETLENIESELMRLSRVCISNLNERRLERINDELGEVRAELDSLTSSATATAAVFPATADTECEQEDTAVYRRKPSSS